MNPWRSYPLIRLAIPFLGGIILLLLHPLYQVNIAFLASMAAVCAFFLCLVNLLLKLSYRLRWIPGLVITASMFCCGCLITKVYHERTVRINESFPDSALTWIAEVREPPRAGKGTIRLITTISCFNSHEESITDRGKCLVMLARDTRSEQLQYGDVMICFIRFHPIVGASNPHGFDPSRYYQTRGIFWQGRADSNDWVKIDCQRSGSVQRIAFTLRDRLLDIFRENGIGGEELAVASALLLGYGSEISQGLRQAYSATGAMHILSVSGMHVGVIYLFLNFLLGFMYRKKRDLILRALIMITVIWGYALITGLSPPVFRAAVMLSLLIMGKTLKRNPETLNILAASLFIMLVADPGLLLDTGFQLSYLAVTGIVLFYKPIYDLMVIPSWLPDKIWSLVSVSVAAQLTTFPLSLYTFHQFPNYFILANVIVVPLSSLIIYTGIWVLSVGNIPVISLYSASGLSCLVSSLNSVIRFMEGLPFSTTSGVYLSLFQVVLIYLLIGNTTLLIRTKKGLYLLLILGCFILFEIRELSRQWESRSQKHLTIFQVKGASVYEFTAGNRSVTVKDIHAVKKSRYTGEILQLFQLGNNIDQNLITYLSSSPSDLVEPIRDFSFLRRKGNFFQFLGQRIGIVDKKIFTWPATPLHLDILILRENPETDLAFLVHSFSPQQIVVDASNSMANSRKWKRESLQLGIPCYSVVEEGGIVLRSGRDSNSRPPP